MPLPKKSSIVACPALTWNWMVLMRKKSEVLMRGSQVVHLTLATHIGKEEGATVGESEGLFV
jgi:hypothetical protein